MNIPNTLETYLAGGVLVLLLLAIAFGFGLVITDLIRKWRGGE